jgi:hypothetical protein
MARWWFIYVPMESFRPPAAKHGGIWAGRVDRPRLPEHSSVPKNFPGCLWFRDHTRIMWGRFGWNSHQSGSHDLVTAKRVYSSWGRRVGESTSKHEKDGVAAIGLVCAGGSGNFDYSRISPDPSAWRWNRQADLHGPAPAYSDRKRRKE